MWWQKKQGPSAGVSGSLDSYCSLKPLCSGMGEVVPARTSPTLLPPSPCTVLSLSCFKVSQCINCRDWHCKRPFSSLQGFSSCSFQCPIPTIFRWWSKVWVLLHCLMTSGLYYRHIMLSCMTTLFWMIAHHQISHHATGKVSCQSGDCRWPFNLPQGFVWLCMWSRNKTFYSTGSYRIPARTCQCGQVKTPCML